MDVFDHVIIGAGHAGYVAAKAVRATRPGDSVALVGEEALPPYERPALSKSLLAGETAPEALFLAGPRDGPGDGIDLRPGVRALRLRPKARQVELADGSHLGYGQLLLATGSRARQLDLPGMHLSGIHYLRTVADSLALREALGRGGPLVIVGAGFVGLEVAATARKVFGCDVTVVEAGGDVLQRAAPDRLRQVLGALHEANGVAFRFGTAVTGFEGAGGALTAVRLGEGDALEARTALVCIGAEPDCTLAAEAGLDVDAGIVTDEFGRSSAPEIWAAGEVARHRNIATGRLERFESWQMAQVQAAMVGANMAGAGRPIAYVPWFWTDQYGHNFQMLGRTGAGLDRVHRRYGDGPASVMLYLDGGRVVGALCIDAGRDVAPIRKAIEAGMAVLPEAAANADIRMKAAFAPA